jgi:hypothetical protein
MTPFFRDWVNKYLCKNTAAKSQIADKCVNAGDECVNALFLMTNAEIAVDVFALCKADEGWAWYLSIASKGSEPKRQQLPIMTCQSIKKAPPVTLAGQSK